MVEVIIMAKPGFLFYFDWKHIFLTLTAEEQGALLMALMAYAESGAQPNFTDRAMALAWSALWPRLDEDARRYEATVQARRNAVNKRWEKERSEKERASHYTPPGKSLSTSAFKPRAAVDDGMDQYLNW